MGSGVHLLMEERCKLAETGWAEGAAGSHRSGEAQGVSGQRTWSTYPAGLRLGPEEEAG